MPRSEVPLAIASRRYLVDNALVPRDLAWDAIYTVAGRLRVRAEPVGVQVRAGRRRSWRQWSVVEGLKVEHNGREIFEPVRSRQVWTGRWTEIQPVQDAAARIGVFIEDQSHPS